MKPDSAPVLAQASQTGEAQWVAGALIRNFMQNAGSTQLASIASIPVFLGVLWNDATPAALVLWAAAAALVAAGRFAVMRRYMRDILPLAAHHQLAFFARHRLLWPASAIVWGLTTALYFDRASLAEQFICWLLMAGLAMFSINGLSSHLRAMRAYLDALCGTALAVMGWQIAIGLQFRGPTQHYWSALLLLIFWLVLRHAGLRLHLTHRKNFELQFRNEQLIESLTRQTRAALDAVDIKNRFLASAAHDIRQPVHALGLYADWLRSEPELVREIAPKIVEATKAVNALFDSLFDLARLDSGKIKLNIENVDLATLLHDLELQYRPLAETRGLQFRLHVVPGTAVSDPILLQRVVGNLISNAVKYTRQGGLMVASRITPHGPRIEVWDTGTGIAPVHQREIFRQFYKVPGHAGTEDGFGLGLYIVSRLVHILGHPLQLASQPGRGTRFRLLLAPTDARQAAERAAAAVAQLASMP